MYAAVSVGFTAFTLTFSDFFGKLKVFHRRMHSFDVVIVSYPLGIKNSLLWLFYYTIGGLFCHCPFFMDRCEAFLRRQRFCFVLNQCSLLPQLVQKG